VAVTHRTRPLGWLVVMGRNPPVATRYDKLAANYLAFVKLAAIRIWLSPGRDYCRDLRRAAHGNEFISDAVSRGELGTWLVFLGRDARENIRTAVIWLNEAIAQRVKPYDGSDIAPRHAALQYIFIVYLGAAGISASSRNFDLNGEAKTDRVKQNRPIIPPA